MHLVRWVIVKQTKSEDQFSTINGFGKIDPQILLAFTMPEFDNWDINERALIERVTAIFYERYSQWMTKVVDPYIRQMELQKERQQSNFSLLYGETQQGKTMIMHLLTWVLIWNTRGYSYVPCYITKNITSLRTDAEDKLALGAINDIVQEVATELGLTSIAREFILKGKTGLKTTGHIRGTVPVFIMNPSNSIKMLKWMKSMSKLVGMHKYPVFFIDEVHELYTNVTSYLNNGALEPVVKSIKGHHLIHYAMKLCKEHRCAMVGITATPQRVLTSDPEVYPEMIYEIPCVPPVPGLKRIGYNGVTNDFQGAEFRINACPLDIVREILNVPPVQLTDGTSQVKFMNICTEHFNADMAAIYEMLTKTFTSEQIYVKMFCQNVPEYRDISVNTLDQFFDLRDVPEPVINSGVMILIGKSREGAGITLKPSFDLKKKGHHAKLIDGQTWSVTGITDMMCKVTENMESTEQLVGRCTGWYDENHLLRIWMPCEKQIHDIRTGIIKTKRAMLERYREHGYVGPKSLLKISNMCLEITKLDTNNLYVGDGVRRGNIGTGQLTALNDIKGHILDTAIIELPEELNKEFFQLMEDKKDMDHHGKIQVSKAFNTKVSAHIGLDSIQLPWTETRYREIIKAAAQPRGTSQWRVNGYGVIADDTLRLVVFNDRWTERKRFGYRCEGCDLGQCADRDHISINDTIYWWDGIYYQYATYTRQMHHRYETEIKNWNLDLATHQEVLSQIDQLIEECRTAIRKKNLYNLFMTLHKNAGVNHKRPSDLNHGAWMGQQWKKFKNDYSELHTEMQALLKACEAGEEDELLIKFEDMMQPYFDSLVQESTTKSQFKFTPPLIKIKVRLRLKPLLPPAT